MPDKLQLKLREEGGIRALLGMVRSRHPDVLAQVARGIANFAKCESRGAAQGMSTIHSIQCNLSSPIWGTCSLSTINRQANVTFDQFYNVDGGACL